MPRLVRAVVTCALVRGHAGAMPAQVDRVDDRPRAGAARTLPGPLAALRRAAAPPARPLGDTVPREGLLLGGCRLPRGRPRASALRRRRGHGGDHPGDAAGCACRAHAGHGGRVRRARADRRFPALRQRPGRGAGATAHPLQDRLRRADGERGPDRGRRHAQPLANSRDVRAAQRGGRDEPAVPGRRPPSRGEADLGGDDRRRRRARLAGARPPRAHLPRHDGSPTC